MEEEGSLTKLNPGQGTPQLLALLASFLQGPDPDIQHKLTLFHPDHYINVISDQTQPKEIKMACCSALKVALTRREHFQQDFDKVLSSLEALYLSGNDDINNSLEFVLEKLFEVYLDDQKKLGAFEGVIDRLAACKDIRMSNINERALKIGMLLVRGMAPSTLNNQICVGGLFFYLKQLYYAKHQSNIPYDPSGRGIDLILEGMSSTTLRPQVQLYYQVQIEIVKLIRQIISRVQEQQTQEPEVIPGLYMRNSKQIESLLTRIICATNSTTVYGLNQKINQFKAEMLQLYAENYMYRLERAFLLSALATITSTRAAELSDYSMQIVTSLLLLTERSTSYGDYNQYFFGVTQALILKLFEFIAARDAEKDAINNDPEYFAEIADDFCKTQESQSMKARAGSLLYNLCMYIDGNLTFVTKFALISLYDLQRRSIAALTPESQIRPDVLQSQNAMKTLMDLWAFGAQSFTETSILVLSSISDLLAKRQQFNRIIRQHLSIMLNLFRMRDQVLNFFPPIILCRYLQLVSYFSGPGCLDPFVPLFTLHEAIAQSLLKGLQTIIQFHDKKDQNMANYVANIAAKILLLPDRLTPLLETTIVSRPQLLQCVKQRLVEKLVVWILKYISNSNIFGCNKISNLLTKVISQYPEYLSRVQEDVFQLELEALSQYLSPLYHHLISGEQRQAQQCVIEVAVAHAEILKTAMNAKVAQDFVKLGMIIVDRNSGVLSKCLELFSKLLNTAHMKTLIANPEYVKLREINLWVAGQLLMKIPDWISIVQLRNQNVWELTCLVEILLGTFEATEQAINSNILGLDKLFGLCKETRSRVVIVKAFTVAFLVSRLCLESRGLSEMWISQNALPELIPPPEKDHLSIYIMRAISKISQPEVRARLVTYVLSLLIPNESMKNYYATYEARIHTLGSNTDQCEVYAFQAMKDIRHPLQCWPTDVFDQFREMFRRIEDWEPVRVYLSPNIEEKIRAALQMRKVGARVRRIVKIKPMKF